MRVPSSALPKKRYSSARMQKPLDPLPSNEAKGGEKGEPYTIPTKL